MDITELLAFSAKNGASDLHLSAGLPPMIRVDGEVRRINLPAMEHKDVIVWSMIL
jgi:twitching motility protein PilT